MNTTVIAIVAALGLLLAAVALGVAAFALRRSASGRARRTSARRNAAQLPTDVEGLRSEVQALRVEVSDALRHLAVVRYDAFGDMGGRLSWSVALLDDNGDGVGTSAAEQGGDGAQASRTYLDADMPGAAPTDEELLKLLQRKALLDGELEELKIRKAFLAAEEYAKEFERIITEYSRIASEVRKRTKT